MKPWVLLDTTPVPDDGELQLYQRGEEYSIKIAAGGELMSSRVHGSEEALAAQSCARLADADRARILIGGLGMGFTLAAALRHAGSGAQIVVAELVPGVVAWNRGPLAGCAGRPLDDPRVQVHEGDVVEVIKTSANVSERAFDAILLDVDNGPEGLTQQDNNWLYGMDGLSAAYQALRPLGVLAVWSAGPSQAFTARLQKAGFEVEEQRVHAHGKKGARHTLWFARRPA